jgi:hypothetical protein
MKERDREVSYLTIYSSLSNHCPNRYEREKKKKQSNHHRKKKISEKEEEERERLPIVRESVSDSLLNQREEERGHQSFAFSLPSFLPSFLLLPVIALVKLFSKPTFVD